MSSRVGYVSPVTLRPRWNAIATRGAFVAPAGRLPPPFAARQLDGSPFARVRDRAGDVLMRPRTLRGGLIGCGYFALNHLHAWSEVRGAEIVAVCDRTLELVFGAYASAASGTTFIPELGS